MIPQRDRRRGRALWTSIAAVQMERTGSTDPVLFCVGLRKRKKGMLRFLLLALVVAYGLGQQ